MAKVLDNLGQMCLTISGELFPGSFASFDQSCIWQPCRERDDAKAVRGSRALPMESLGILDHLIRVLQDLRSSRPCWKETPKQCTTWVSSCPRFSKGVLDGIEHLWLSHCDVTSEMSEKFLQQCEFAVHGCTAKLSPTTGDLHKKTCPFRDVDCPVCDEKVSLRELGNQPTNVCFGATFPVSSPGKDYFCLPANHFEKSREYRQLPHYFIMGEKLFIWGAWFHR